MRAYGRLVLTCSLLMGACWLAACGGSGGAPSCDKPELLRLDFSPFAQLNHDREGYARSVVVRAYQLQETEPFEQIGFDDIWLGDDRGVLGASLVGGPDELTVVPAKRDSRELKRNPKATHLGLAANFREHHPNSGWKAIVALPRHRDPCKDRGPRPRLLVELAHYVLAPQEWAQPRGAR